MNKNLSFKIRVLQRRIRWTLTWQGWAALLSILATGIVSITFIQPFLALISPVNADVLVVEGWLPDYALQQALNEFERGWCFTDRFLLNRIPKLGNLISCNIAKTWFRARIPDCCFGTASY